MADRIHVLGFAGSLRKDSFNRSLLRAAEEMLPESMSLETYDLSNIPLYNGDVEAEGDPEPVRHFKERIAAADAILVVTPEYSWGIPGVLKNALDWASRPTGQAPLKGKPVAIMGASSGNFGTVRAQLQLRHVFAYNDMYPLSQPQVLVTQAQNKFDDRGRLTDEPTREMVRSLLAAFESWIRRLK